MFLYILKSQWLSFRRSPTFGQSVGINILLGFVAVYFLLCAIGIGFAAPFLLSEYHPDSDPVYIFSGYVGFYLAIDLLIRFMVQKYPAIDVHKYVNVNIQKNTIVKFLLFRSLFSFFNFLPLFFLIPFFLMSAVGSMSMGAALMWLTLMIALVLLNHYFSFWLYLRSFKQPILTYTILIGIVGICFLEYKGIISIHEYFCQGMSYLYESAIILVPLFLLGIMIIIDFKILRHSAYIDENTKQGSYQKIQSFESNFLAEQGTVGKLINMEINLIWRNKKAKNYLFMSFAFIPYFFLQFYDSQSQYFMIVMCMITTGAFMLNYAQYLLSWNTSHLDLLLTNHINLNSFILSKYLLLVGSCGLFFILNLPIAIVNPRLALIALVMMLFNMGFISYVYIYFGILFSKKMDPNASSILNYEGTSAAHFLIIIPIVLAPLIFYTPFDLLGYELIGLVALATIGCIGILCHKWILHKLTATFKKQKYNLHHKFTS